MAKNKKKRYEINRVKNSNIDKVTPEIKDSNNNEKKSNHSSTLSKDLITSKNKEVKVKNHNIKNEKNLEQNVEGKKNLQSKLIELLENKHVPIFSRFYKIFWVFRKNPEEKKKMIYNLLIFFGGLFVVAIALLLASLAITGVINVDFGGSSGSDIFPGISLAIAVIVGIII